MNQQTPSEYLHNKNMRENTLFRINDNGEGFYILNGYEMTRQEMEQTFPYARFIVQRKDFKRESIDSTRNYLH